MSQFFLRYFFPDQAKFEVVFFKMSKMMLKLNVKVKHTYRVLTEAHEKSHKTYGTAHGESSTSCHD